MSGCKGRRQCGRGVAGSGYTKQTDTANTKELDAQMAAALAARNALDAQMFTAFTGVNSIQPSSHQMSQTLPLHGASSSHPAAHLQQ